MLLFSLCFPCYSSCLLHTSFSSTRSSRDEELCPQQHLQCTLRSALAAQDSAACFQSKFSLMKRPNQLDSDVASIFGPSVMNQALAHILLHLIIENYKRKKVLWLLRTLHFILENDFSEGLSDGMRQLMLQDTNDVASGSIGELRQFKWPIIVLYLNHRI